MASKFIGKYSLNGRLAIVTGASQGLGKTTAQTLSAMGADVVLAVRNVAATKSMIEREMVPWVKQQQPSAQPSIQAMSLDLASFESVRGFVQQLSQIYPKRSPSLLINNAGAMMKQRSVTVDENEYLLQVNYLSPVLLSLLVLRDLALPAVQAAPLTKIDFRAVQLSTGLHQQGKLNFDDLQLSTGYDNMKAYCQSKLALNTFNNFLQRSFDQGSTDASLAFLSDLQKSSVFNLRSVSVDPGYIKTNLVRADHGFSDTDIKKLMGAAKMTLDQGVATTIATAVREDVVGGTFWAREKVGKEKAEAKDSAVQDKLWDQTRSLIHWQ